VVIFDIKDYMKKLETLRKNKENVPEELLKTKYSKPYNELRTEIQKMTEELVRKTTLSKIIILKEDIEKELPVIQKVIDENDYILKNISRAVFIDQDIEKVFQLTYELEDKIRESWRPYFESHCIKGADKKIRCRLLDDFWNSKLSWNEDHKQWEGIDNETGAFCWITWMAPGKEVRHGS
jgi:hypothetical protein